MKYFIFFNTNGFVPFFYTQKIKDVKLDYVQVSYIFTKSK